MATVARLEPIAASYAALELRPGATLADAARSYRRLARLTHPDVSGAPTGEQFRAVRSAYETIRAASGAGNAWRRARALESYAPPAARPSRLVDVRA